MPWDDDFLGARASRPHKAWHSFAYLPHFDQPGTAPLQVGDVVEAQRPPSGEHCWLPAASMARLATRGISGQSGAPRRRTPFKGAGCGRPGTGGGGRVGSDRMRAGRPRSQGMPSGCAAGGVFGGRLLKNLTRTQAASSCRRRRQPMVEFAGNLVTPGPNL